MAINLGNSDLTASYIGTNLVKKAYLGTDKVYDIFISASGGAIGTFTSGSDTYTYHTFNSSSTFTVHSTGKNYLNTNTLNILVVGGGGGATSQIGTYWNGAGGGGVVTSSVVPNTGVYTVTVGNGGSFNNNGSQSVFTSGSFINLIASGGLKDGTSGAPASLPKGSDVTNCYTFYNAGGGGGGAMQSGSNAQCASFGFTNGAKGGVGGDGIGVNFRGTLEYFGGGGGGGSDTDPAGAAGGQGGGGRGRRVQSGIGWNNLSGLPNTGGGSGGGTDNTTTGGSGVVIVYYKS